MCGRGAEALFEQGDCLFEIGVVIGVAFEERGVEIAVFEPLKDAALEHDDDEASVKVVA